MNKIKLIIIFLLPLLTNMVLAQEQNNEKKPLPELTIEQKWQRSNWMVDVMMITGINQAKSNGNTVKYWGEFIGELFAPGWEGIKTPWGMLRGMYRNYQLNPGFEMKMIKESNDAVTFRFNRPYKSRFGDSGEAYGVSLKEYEKAMEVFHTYVANHLGFNYSQRLDGDWNVISIRNKKR